MKKCFNRCVLIAEKTTAEKNLNALEKFFFRLKICPIFPFKFFSKKK